MAGPNTDNWVDGFIMPSNIDPTQPQDGVPASKADLRANLAAAKSELDHGGFAEGHSPANYTAATSRVVDHLAGIDAALGASGNPSAFTGLADTPASYVGQANRYPRVRADETGLEFVDQTPGADASSTTYTQAGTGAVTRTVQAKLSEIISVSDFGAHGDGATDDRAAIQAAIDRASTLGGGFVEFPAGTFIVGSSLLLPSGVILRGQGHVATTIKLANGANAHVIKTDNFDSQTLQNRWFTDTQGVRHGFGLLHLCIHGNRANNSSGHGVAFYGKNYIVHDVFIHSCAGDGFYSECGDTVGQHSIDDSPETMIGFLRISGTNGVGFRWRGPHDGMAETLVVNGGRGDNVSIENLAGAYHGTIDIQRMHIYSNGIGSARGLVVSSKCRIGFAIVESSGRENVVINDHQVQIGILYAYLGKHTFTGSSPVPSVLILGNENQIANLRVHIHNADGGLYIAGHDNRVATGHIDGLDVTHAVSGLRIWGNRNTVKCNIQGCSSTGSVAATLGRNLNGGVTTVDMNRLELMLSNNANHLDVRATPTKTWLDAIIDDTGLDFASGSNTAPGATERWTILS